MLIVKCQGLLIFNTLSKVNDYKIYTNKMQSRILIILNLRKMQGAGMFF